MSEQPALDTEKRLVSRALSISVLEGSLHAVMLGVSETYLGAFAVELGHGPENIAILVTLPLFLGALSQLASGTLSRLLGRKRLAVVGAALQALCHSTFIAIALLDETGLWPLLLGKCLFWVSGGVMAPAWSDWITSLTSGIPREPYFARRFAIINVTLLFAFCVSGWSLQYAGSEPLRTYAVLFFVGLCARLASAVALAVQADPEPRSVERTSAWQRTRAAVSEGRFHVVIYLALMMFGASVAIPFFTPYMLEELGLSYGEFAALSAVSIVTKAIVFPMLHRLSRSIGLRAVLPLAGAGVAIVPLMWALSADFRFLILVHVVSGAAWASLEFASFQLLMNDVRAGLRTEFFSLSNTASGSLQLLGSVLGGYALKHGWLGYTDVFLWSFALRALPLVGLFFIWSRLRAPKILRLLPTRLLSVRPSAGATQRPILTDGVDEMPEPVDTVLPEGDSRGS